MSGRFQLSSRRVHLGAAIVTLVFAAAACGDDSNTGGSGSNGGGTANGGSGGSNVGGSNTGGDPSSSSTGFSDGGNSSTGEGGGCAGESIKGEKRPLDMYVMFDQSGSMTESVSGGGDKWDAVTKAFATFVQQPAAVGLGVGIQYFPLQVTGNCPATCQTNADCAACGGACFIANGLGTCSGSVDSCNAADYATPDVPIQELPGVAGEIIGSLVGRVPVGATPTSAALQGAIDYTTSWAAANPEHVTIVVLATDGNPTECNTNLDQINAIAATAAAGSPPVLTFVIGVGSSLTALNGIAAAGGTDKAFLVSSSNNVTEQFLDALNEISGKALGCIYTIPTPEMGEVDYKKVNVNYTPSGSTSVNVPKVEGAASCPINGLGWYYDNPAAPTQILLCDSTCQTVSADKNGQVDIVLGCETIIQ